MRLGGLFKRGCKFTAREEEEVLVFHDRVGQLCQDWGGDIVDKELAVHAWGPEHESL